MQQPALTHVDDAIFAAAIEDALDILEPNAALQATYAENLVNIGPNGATINNRTATSVADAQIVLMRAAWDAWVLANP